MQYHLILNRYLKLTKEDEKTYLLFFEALNLMKRLNNEINNKIPDLFPLPVITTTSNMEKLRENYGEIVKEACI